MVAQINIYNKTEEKQKHYKNKACVSSVNSLSQLRTSMIRR